MAIQAVNNGGTYAGSNANVSKSTAPVEAEKVEVTKSNSGDAVAKQNKSGAASEQMIKDAVNEANNKLKVNKRHCQFTYEKDINRVSVKLIDEETGDVIREIPSEETLDMLRRLKDMTGLLVDEHR